MITDQKESLKLLSGLILLGCISSALTTILLLAPLSPYIQALKTEVPTSTHVILDIEDGQGHSQQISLEQALTAITLRNDFQFAVTRCEALGGSFIPATTTKDGVELPAICSSLKSNLGYRTQVVNFR